MHDHLGNPIDRYTVDSEMRQYGYFHGVYNGQQKKDRNLMQRDDTAIVRILAEQERNLRGGLIDLIQAGTPAYTLEAVVNALGAIETAGLTVGKQQQEDEDEY